MTTSRRIELRGGHEGRARSTTCRLSIAVFNTDYTDLPYQVSTTTGGGLQHGQHRRGSDLARRRAGKAPGLATDNFRLHTTVGLHRRRRRRSEPGRGRAADTGADGVGQPRAHVSRSASGEITLRADWSFRDDMFGEPSNDPAPVHAHREPRPDQRRHQLSSRRMATGSVGRLRPEHHGRALRQRAAESRRITSSLSSRSMRREFGVRITKQF